jgi:beta-lactamase class A
MIAVPVTPVVLLASLLQPSLPATFARIAQDSGGRVGAFATIVEAGSERAGLNESERFPMQSVYKLPIAMAVLDQVERGTLALDRAVTLAAEDMAPSALHSPLRDRHPRGGIDLTIRALIRAAVADSDGTASDALLRAAGGGERVTEYLRRAGITDMAVATTEVEMSRDPMAQYRNYSTPQAAVALLTALFTGRTLSPASRRLLLDDMIASTPGRNRLKGRLPRGTVVAHKTGTDGTRGGMTRATNDIGIVTLPDGRHMAIAVFVKDSTAAAATREGVIARIARAAWDRWAGR